MTSGHVNFTPKKGKTCIKMKFNSQGFSLEHQNGRCDVMWKRSIHGATQPRRRRWHKFAYLTMKNSSLHALDMHYSFFAYFAAVIVNQLCDLICFAFVWTTHETTKFQFFFLHTALLPLSEVHVSRKLPIAIAKPTVVFVSVNDPCSMKLYLSISERKAWKI